MPRKPLTKDTPTAFQNLPPDKLREITSKGGKATAQVTRRKKTIRECLKMLGQMKVTEKERDTILKVFPELNDEEMTKNCLVSAAMYQKAAQGDTKAFSKITETTGEKTVVVAGDPDNPIGQANISIDRIKELKSLLDKDD